MDFAIPADHRVKFERKRKPEEIHGPCQRAEKALEYVGNSDTNQSWIPWKIPNYPVKREHKKKEIPERIVTVELQWWPPASTCVKTHKVYKKDRRRSRNTNMYWISKNKPQERYKLQWSGAQWNLWLKWFTVISDGLTQQLRKCLHETKVPE